MIKVNGKMVKYGRFPDKTLNIKGNSSLKDDTILIDWHYANDAEFMAVAFLTKFYQAHGNEVVLFMPYVPNARMDRIENANDIFTMKYFAELINSLNFEKVFVMDVHSSVAMATINRCHLINPKTLNKIAFLEIKRHEGHLPIMFYPDEGAMKRYSGRFKLPYAYGVKKRDWKSGEILGLEVLGLSAREIKGKNILIQDDICSKGGTFYYAAKKLKEMGAANIYLLVTHCEDSIHTGEFGENKVNLLDTGLIKHVFTTDSIYSRGQSNMISVVSLTVDYKPHDGRKAK